MKAHPEITVGTDAAWAPMDFVDRNGKPQGTEIDYIKLIDSKLEHVKFTPYPGPWSEIYEKVKEVKLDIITGIKELENRKPFFNFTQAYDVPFVMITPKGTTGLKVLKDLCFIQSLFKELLHILLHRNLLY